MPLAKTDLTTSIYFSGVIVVRLRVNLETMATSIHLNSFAINDLTGNICLLMERHLRQILKKMIYSIKNNCSYLVFLGL